MFSTNEVQRAHEHTAGASSNFCELRSIYGFGVLIHFWGLLGLISLEKDKNFFKMSVILFTWINKRKYIEKSFCHKLQLRLTVLSGSMWLFYHSWVMCLTNYTPTSHLFSLNSQNHLLANTRNHFFAGDCFLARYRQRATHSRLHKWRGARQAETTAKCISLQQHWFIQ